MLRRLGRYHYQLYLLGYRRHGINVQALSVQNEPVAVKPALYSVEEGQPLPCSICVPRLIRQGYG